ncbi:putative polynucleotide kinase 3-phosphatase [Trypanosoma grayi]|uniref:putative polynucleotide kinase 3-phosphatase n=1 Tax=Trypanosoma grayi TaxID=71804 RepID=UPI0004F440E4|nr:putative polynucleotide kinase 3-phosphatase [Trypanosoma grayi]KEG10793.1 putative polynucleotide kinase 3-phosphatase [Trypanosoma grayi]
MKRARSTSPQILKKKLLPISSLSDWKLLHNSVLVLPPSVDLVRRSLVGVAGESSYFKVAAFDLDDTLIVPRNGAVFPRDDPSDWKWLLPVVPSHLRLLYDEGFMLVVLSNQSGIGGKGWNEKKAEAIKQKIIAVSKALNIPLAAFISTKEDVWRKPNVGMWTLLQEHASAAMTKEVTIAEGPSGFVFYAGDAAGRKTPTLAGRKKDFSCSDRKFAFNIRVPFLTPEQLYRCPAGELLEGDEHHHGGSDVDWRLSSQLLALGTAPPCEIDWGGVGPNELKALPSSYEKLPIARTTADGTRSIVQLPTTATFDRESQELVVFVGCPGCGKTTFFNRFFKPAGYAHINRDTLKTKEKCLLEAERCWKAGKSLVIDNTNPSHDDCMQFIRLVKRLNPQRTPLPVRVFVFQASKELSMHMSNVRARLGLAPRISRIAYNVFQSKYEAWTVASLKSAGIEELLEIPPVACFDGLHEDTRREFFLLS